VHHVGFTALTFLHLDPRTGNVQSVGYQYGYEGTGWVMEELVFDAWWRNNFCLFTKASRRVVRLTEIRTQGCCGLLGWK
jgi:hypothetical protein